jgi:hypothetical protein
VATGVAGFSYAFGWVLAARYFGEFGVDPEAAGVSFSWLAIRAFLVGLVALGVFLLVRQILRAARRLPVDAPTLYRGGKLLAIIVLGCVAAALVVVLAELMLRRRVDAGDLVAPLGVAVVIALGATMLLRPISIEALPRMDRLLRGVAGFLIGFAVAGSLLTPYLLGEHLAEDVRHGQPIDLQIVPGVPALQAPRVRLTLVDSAQTRPEMAAFLGCVVRLGGADGTSLYYAEGSVLRVADENVYAVQPC